MKRILFFAYCLIFIATGNLSAQVIGDEEDTLQHPAEFSGFLSKWIMEHTTYPSKIKDTIHMRGVVHVSFRIEKDGSVSEVALVKGIAQADTLNEQALHIVSQMPKWKPATENGTPVKSHYITVAIGFKVYNKHSNGPDTVYGRNDDGSIFSLIQIKPKFNGDIYKWLADHIEYPQNARESNIQGTVYISFIVEKNGAVSDVKVEQGVEASLDKEAVRAISSMPKWVPGTQNGKPCRLHYLVPIHFKLG